MEATEKKQPEYNEQKINKHLFLDSNAPQTITQKNKK